NDRRNRVATWLARSSSCAPRKNTRSWSERRQTRVLPGGRFAAGQARLLAGRKPAPLGHEPHRAAAVADAVEEFLEDADVEGGGRLGFGVELGTQGPPVLLRALDGFDHAIRAAGGDLEAGADVVDRLVVHAVDADFAVAKDALHQRAEDDRQAVAVLRIVRVLVRDRAGHFFRQVQEQSASLR